MINNRGNLLRLIKSPMGVALSAIGIYVLCNFYLMERLLLDLDKILLINLAGGLFFLASIIIPDMILGFFLSGTLTFLFFVMAPSLNEISGWSLLPPLSIVFYYLFRSERVKFYLGWIVYIVIFYYILLIIGVLYTPIYQDAMIKIWHFSYYNFMPFIGALILSNSRRHLGNILFAFCMGLILWGIFGPFFIDHSVAVLDERLSPELLGPIGYGRLAGLSSIFIICFLFTCKKFAIFKCMLIPIGLWLLYNMLRTGTRGVLVAFVITVWLIITVYYKHIISMKYIIITSVIALAVFAASLFIPQEITERVFYSESYINEIHPSLYYYARYNLYRDAWDMFQSSPVFGLGTSAFRIVSIYPHNIFLEFAVEFGIVGLFVICTFVYLSIKYALIPLLSLNYDIGNPYRNLMLFFFAGFCFTFLGAQFSSDVLGNRNLWFLSGLIWGTYNTAIADDLRSLDFVPDVTFIQRNRDR